MIRRHAPLLILLAATGTCRALINPHFTPKHLAGGSDVIFAGTLAAGAGAGQWKLTVTQPLRGKGGREHAVSLARCDKDYVADVRRTLKANGAGPVILFASGPQKKAYLHVAGTWLAVRPAGAGTWDVTGLAPRMSATFAGGTDMLTRMTRHLLADARADVPVSAGVAWLDFVRVGRARGEPSGMAGVTVGKGGVHLFVGCAGGDRLFRPKGRDEQVTFEDVTAKAALAAKSRRFAWVDVNADGLADLVSWDGERLTTCFAEAAGTFRAGGAAWSYRPGGRCAGLAACARAGRPGVLVSSGSLPIHLAAGADGWRAATLPGGPALAKGAGVPSACVVADFDGDGLPDVLRPAERAGVLWRGKAGGFDAPAVSAVAAGAGPAVAAVGDFDAGGTLDVFLAGGERATLWSNDGSGGFREVLRLSGSLSYKCPPRPAAAGVLDLNHDGLADLCLVYRAGNLLYHFNRGFRSFGEEGEVRLEGLAPPGGGPAPGQVALAAADFNADGSQDLAVTCADGGVWCCLNEMSARPAVRLRLGKGLPGPITATCRTGAAATGPLTAISVTGPSPAGLVAMPRPGRLTIRYRLPDQSERTLAVVVTRGPKDVVLTAGPVKRAAGK